MLLPLLFFASFAFVHPIVYSLDLKRSTQKKCEWILLFLMLVSFFCFRGLPVLNDTAHYYNHFNEIVSSYSFDSTPFYEFNPFDRFEPGYQIYENFIGHFISKYPYTIILVSAFLIALINVYFFCKETDNPSLAIMIMLCAGTMLKSFSGLRQGLACGLTMLAFLCLKDKKLILSVGLSLLAFTFHGSAIMFFFIYLFDKMRVTRGRIVWAILLMGALSYGINHLFAFFGQTDSIYYEVGLSRSTFMLAAFINVVTAIMFIYIGYCLYRRNTNPFGGNVYWWSAVSSVVFLVLSLSFGIVGRYANYFYPFIVVLLVNNLSLCKKSVSHALKLAIIIFCIVRITGVMNLKNEWDHFVPYSFYDFPQNPPNEVYYGY